MIRKFLFATVLLWLPCAALFSQGIVDNNYGDYLINGNDKLISLDLEGAAFIDVLKLLSQQTGFNFVMSQNVAPRNLTLYLNNTPLKDAMNIIFKANNLSYDYYTEGNIFIIKDIGAPAVETVTKTYKLKYARVNTSSMASERGATLGTTGGTDINAAIARMLTPQGKIIEDSLTNSLIITDVSTQFPVIEQVINSMDVPMPQVMIEVEMLDVSKTLVDELGMKLGEKGGDLVTYTPGTRSSYFPWPERLQGATKGTATMGTLSLTGMDLAMQMFASDSTTKSLARPKILTVVNEAAEVNLTVDEVVGIKKTTSDDGDDDYETERATTGTKLRVTPQLNPETNEITLVLQIFNREAKDAGVGLINGMSPKNIEERSTKSLVRLKNGETLLIGGLLKQTNEGSVTKTPFLSDIPLVGKMFKYKARDDKDRELLVFLTPRLVDYNKEKSDNVICREQQDTVKIESMKSALDKVEVKKEKE